MLRALVVTLLWVVWHGHDDFSLLAQIDRFEEDASKSMQARKVRRRRVASKLFITPTIARIEIHHCFAPFGREAVLGNPKPGKHQSHLVIATMASHSTMEP